MVSVIDGSTVFDKGLRSLVVASNTGIALGSCVAKVFTSMYIYAAMHPRLFMEDFGTYA